MRNPYISEVFLQLDGEPVRLRLTLGALAALEGALGCEDISSLVERFSEGKFSARDIIHVLNAGLYGVGDQRRIEEMRIEGGAKEAAQAAMELLVSAFPKSIKTNAL